MYSLRLPVLGFLLHSAGSVRGEAAAEEEGGQKREGVRGSPRGQPVLGPHRARQGPKYPCTLPRFYCQIELSLFVHYPLVHNKPSNDHLSCTDIIKRFKRYYKFQLIEDGTVVGPVLDYIGQYRGGDTT